MIIPYFILITLLDSTVAYILQKRTIHFTTKLKCTTAVSTAEAIEPAKYLNDLYGVLGVTKNASAKELKQAYWNIAMRHHPDRNDSQEALWLYQNASHAYAILGRDPEKRKDYDLKLETSEFISALGDVTNGVGNVAVPLLNMTYNAAIPFLKDAFDMSSAAFEALVEDPIDDTSKGFFSRIASAIGFKNLEHKIRRSKEQLEATTALLNETQVELLDAIEAERKASIAFSGAKEAFELKKEEYEIAQRETTRVLSLLPLYIATCDGSTCVVGE